MTQQKALWLPENQGALVVGTAPIWTPGPGEVLIKVEAVGLNPVDKWIPLAGILVDTYPTIIGVDAAGTVEALGKGVTQFKKGDRVIRDAPMDHKEFGAFQQYTLAYADTTAKIPDNVSFEQAATLPLGIATAAVAAYHDGVNAIGGTLGLTPVWEEGGRGKYRGQPTIVFGGASSVGQYAIQLFKLSGFGPIITTASLRNAETLKVLGATHVLDRNLTAEELTTEVLKITSEPFKVIYDAVGSPETQNLGYDILASGGTMASVRVNAIKPEKKVADKKAFMMYGSFTRTVNRKLGASFFSKLTELLENGDIKPNRVEIVPGGLQGIPTALDRFLTGVSCVKLVAHPQENL